MPASLDFKANMKQSYRLLISSLCQIHNIVVSIKYPHAVIYCWSQYRSSTFLTELFFFIATHIAGLYNISTAVVTFQVAFSDSDSPVVCEQTDIFPTSICIRYSLIGSFTPLCPQIIFFAIYSRDNSIIMDLSIVRC